MSKRTKKKHGKGSTRADLETRAQEILDKGVILDIGNNIFRVSSQSQKDKYYDVTFLDVWKCECPYNINQHGDCKHIIAVQYLVMKTLPIIIDKEFEIKEPSLKCPRCDSCDCEYYQTRKTLSGESVRYKCTQCKKRFTWRPGYLGRHCSSQMITDVLEDVVTGKSTESAARGVKKRAYSCLKKTISKWTVWRWTRDYANMTNNIIKSIAIQVSDKWQVDEIFFKTKGDEYWMFGMMDSESRFMISTSIGSDKEKHDSADLFQDSVDTAEKTPNVLISDKLDAFDKAFKKIMGRKNATKSGAKRFHIRSVSIRCRHVHNNVRERINGTIRDRIKTARGFNSEFPPLLRLFMFYYNFLRPHSGLNGKTPAEKAGVKIMGNNTWHTVISYAAIHC